MMNGSVKGEISIFKTRIGEEYNFDRTPDSEGKNFLLFNFLFRAFRDLRSIDNVAFLFNPRILILGSDRVWDEDMFVRDGNTVFNSSGGSTAYNSSLQLGSIDAGMVGSRVTKDSDGNLVIILHNRFTPPPVSVVREIKYISMGAHHYYANPLIHRSLVRLHTPCSQASNEIVDIFYRIKLSDGFKHDFLLNNLLTSLMNFDRIDPNVERIRSTVDRNLIISRPYGSFENGYFKLDDGSIGGNLNNFNNVFLNTSRRFDVNTGISHTHSRIAEGVNVGCIYRYLYSASCLDSTHTNGNSQIFYCKEPNEIKTNSPIQGSWINQPATIVPFLGNLGNSTLKYTLEANSDFKDEIAPRAYFLEFIKGGSNGDLGKYRVKTKRFVGYNGNSFNARAETQIAFPNLTFIDAVDPKNSNTSALLNVDSRKIRYFNKHENREVVYGLGFPNWNTNFLKVDEESFISYFTDRIRKGKWDRSKGISYYNIKTNELKCLGFYEGYDYDEVNACAVKDRKVYIACDNGLHVLDLDTELSVKIDPGIVSLEDKACVEVEITKDGNIVAIFDGGVVEITDEEIIHHEGLDFSGLVDFDFKRITDVCSSKKYDGRVFICYATTQRWNEINASSTNSNGAFRYVMLDLKNDLVDYLTQHTSHGSFVNSQYYFNKGSMATLVDKELGKENLFIKLRGPNSRMLEINLVAKSLSQLDLRAWGGDMPFHSWPHQIYRSNPLIHVDDSTFVSCFASGGTGDQTRQCTIEYRNGELKILAVVGALHSERSRILKFGDLYLTEFVSDGKRSFGLSDIACTPTDTRGSGFWETYGWDGTQWVLNHTEGKEMDTNPTSLPYGVDISWQYPTGTEIAIENEYLTFSTYNGIVQDNTSTINLEDRRVLANISTVDESILLDTTIPTVGAPIENAELFPQINYSRTVENNSIVLHRDFSPISRGSLSGLSVWVRNRARYLGNNQNRVVETSQILDGDFKITIDHKTKEEFIGLEASNFRNDNSNLTSTFTTMASQTAEFLGRYVGLFPAGIEPLDDFLTSHLVFFAANVFNNHGNNTYFCNRRVGQTMLFINRPHTLIEIERVGLTYTLRSLDAANNNNVTRTVTFDIDMDKPEEALMAGPVKFILSDGSSAFSDAVFTANYQATAPIVNIGNLLSQTGKYDLDFIGLTSVDEIEVGGESFEVLEYFNGIPPQGKVVAQTSGELRFSPEDAGKQITKLRANLNKRYW